MEIKWPESVADVRIGRVDGIVTRHTRLHRTLLLLREDDKLREHIQPVSASVTGIGQVEFIFACTALGKALLDAAFWRSNEISPLCGQSKLTMEMLKCTNGETLIRHAWIVFADTVEDIDAHFDAITDSLNEIMKEGI